MIHFTSTARKDGRWWVVQCDQEPGALSQVARLDQAEEHQREAISIVTDIPEDEIEVTVVPELDNKVRLLMDLVREQRATAERLQQEASTTIAAIVQKLVDQDQLSLRDAGFTIGVSHQRVAQLLQQAKEREVAVPQLVDLNAGVRQAIHGYLATAAALQPLSDVDLGVLTQSQEVWTAASQAAAKQVAAAILAGEDVNHVEVTFEDGTWVANVEPKAQPVRRRAKRAVVKG